MKYNVLSPVVNKRKKTIEFHINNSCANQIELTGSFNNWAKNQLMLRRKEGGYWSIEIPMPPNGRYHYKFYIDGTMPMEDIENPMREPDGINGWNSVLLLGD